MELNKPYEDRENHSDNIRNIICALRYIQQDVAVENAAAALCIKMAVHQLEETLSSGHKKILQ